MVGMVVVGGGIVDCQTTNTYSVLQQTIPIKIAFVQR